MHEIISGVMNEPAGVTRSDTPDPRVGTYNMDIPGASSLPSVWSYLGTNNSALKGSKGYRRSLSTGHPWTPNSVGLHENPLFPYDASKYRQKRHWANNDQSSDDPPCKVWINEEKVSRQFNSMSLRSDSLPANDTQTFTINAMWDRYHELEDKLNSDVDEGVDMGGEEELLTSQEPTLHISPNLKSHMSIKKNLPQILVPKPCKEVVLWQPSGVELLKQSAEQDDCHSPTNQELKNKRKKLTADKRNVGSSLLSVPTIRPDTPPPNARASPLSQDIPVCFVDETDGDRRPEMDMT